MEAVILDWINLVLRWAHMIFGIAWIGSSFFFIWLDLSLRRRDGQAPGVSGSTWLVHGGGFYEMEKYAVAPQRMPEELHWFKYEAYFTWISGFALLAVIYYWGAESFLIDRAVMDLRPAAAIAISLATLAGAWVSYDLICKSTVGKNTMVLAVLVFILAVAGAYAFTHLFSGRAAYVHAGAMLGTLMAANVFFIIIPNQKKTTAALTAGRTPDAAWGRQAKQRSTHNNYLTLPVLLMMISNHYPITYGHRWNWLIFAVILIVGGVVRHFFNTKSAGSRGGVLAWQWPVAAALVAGLVIFTVPGNDRDRAGGQDIIGEAEAFAIVQVRCASCHGAAPTDADFEKAPGGVTFDTLAQIRAHATRILAQVVIAKAMPLANKTEMTEAERAKLGAWIRAGTPE